jgi:diadenosine tetraphosphate (Ap4A) HIT family hydrolase
MDRRHILWACAGGTVELPGKVLNDRRDGGHLLVNPPREVWERSELSPLELTNWSFLVAATGRAMLDALPQLADGCVNYWEAGNWALNDLASPLGPKNPKDHRRVHLHVLGRSRLSQHQDWQWGESPRFPMFAESDQWAAQFVRLTGEECEAIALRVQALLSEKYPMV